MEQTTPANVTNHYRNNRDAYDKIRRRLSDTRSAFLNSNRSGQIDMLRKSHAFAVCSIQAQVDSHEKAYGKIAQDYNSGRPITWDLQENVSNLNYCNQKADWIEYGFDHSHVFDTAAAMLEMSQVDEAHKHLIDNMKGVSATKAAFMLAMLGFTQKMCIDTNVQQLVGIDPINTVVVSRYEDSCQKIRDRFPTMDELVEPFLFQWILFDYQRGNISNHDVWFESIGIE